MPSISSKMLQANRPFDHVISMSYATLKAPFWCSELTMYVVLIENLTGSSYTAGLSCIDFVWSMTYSITICSLYTQALKGALGKHILILIPFYSILFHVSTRVWKKKKCFFFFGKFWF